MEGCCDEHLAELLSLGSSERDTEGDAAVNVTLHHIDHLTLALDAEGGTVREDKRARRIVVVYDFVSAHDSSIRRMVEVDTRKIRATSTRAMPASRIVMAFARC